MQATQTPPYDILILGASGFTGKYVVREALKFINAPSSPLKSVALAGRSANKLAQTLQWAAYPSPPPSIPILTADISDPPSLHRLCSQTKLVLNCVGPYRLFGEPVAAACANSGFAFSTYIQTSRSIQISNSKINEQINAMYFIFPFMLITNKSRDFSFG